MVNPRTPILFPSCLYPAYILLILSFVILLFILVGIHDLDLQFFELLNI